MNRPLARALSGIFVPLHIPVFLAFLTVWLNPYAFGGWPLGKMFIAQIGIWTFFIPVFGLFIMKKIGFINSVRLGERTERIAPYLMIIMCYTFAFYAIYKYPVPQLVKAMVAGSLLSIILSFFGNNFLKISAHANGMGSLLGACLGLVFLSTKNIEWVIILIAVLSGLVLSARVYLGRHTLQEVFYGFTIGFLTQLFAISLFSLF